MFLRCHHVLSICQFKRIRLIATLALNLIISLPFFEAHSAEKFTLSEKVEIKKLIRQYIKQNPEIVIEAIEDIQRREKNQTATEQSRQLKLNKYLIEKDTADPILGNLDGQIIITEFFDYQCGYCKRMLNILLDISQSNKNVKIILKEYPILGPISTLAAQAALAAKRQDKYSEFHTALMRLRGRLSESAVFQMAKEVGINTEKLQLDMMQPEILKHLERTRELGKKLMIRGTPAFIINDAIFPGALSNQKLLKLIAEAKKNN
jgi:protein-disulfide isomerase